MTGIKDKGFMILILVFCTGLFIVSCDGGNSAGGGDYQSPFRGYHTGYYQSDRGGDDGGIWEIGITVDGGIVGVVSSDIFMESYYVNGSVTDSGDFSFVEPEDTSIRDIYFEGAISSDGGVEAIWNDRNGLSGQAFTSDDPPYGEIIEPQPCYKDCYTEYDDCCAKYGSLMCELGCDDNLRECTSRCAGK